MAGKVFLVKTTNKPGENMVKGWGTIVGAFLLAPLLIDIKHLKHVTLCDTNTAILLSIIVIIIET